MSVDKPAVDLHRGAFVVVTGGRDYPWDEGMDTFLFTALLHYFAPISEIWHGGAIGVDTECAVIAKRFGIATRTFLTEPVLLPQDIQRALLARNAKMMDELDAAIRHDGRRGLAVAFPGQEGTAHAVGHAHRRSIHVVDLRARPYPRKP